MNKIPNGGFPPLKLKKTLEKQNNKDRSFTTKIPNNINIRQILFNNSKSNLITKNDDKFQLEVVNDL